MAMPKRDPKTGRFKKNSGKYTKNSRKRKVAPKRKSVTKVKSNPRKRVYMIKVGSHYYMGEGKGTTEKRNAANYNSMIGAKKIAMKIAESTDKPVAIIQDFV